MSYKIKIVPKEYQRGNAFDGHTFWLRNSTDDLYFIRRVSAKRDGTVFKNIYDAFFWSSVWAIDNASPMMMLRYVIGDIIICENKKEKNILNDVRENIKILIGILRSIKNGNRHSTRKNILNIIYNNKIEYVLVDDKLSDYVDIFSSTVIRLNEDVILIPYNNDDDILSAKLYTNEKLSKLNFYWDEP